MIWPIEMGPDGLETIYGWSITAYTCDCDPSRHPRFHYPKYDSSRRVWVLSIGFGYINCDEQTPAEIRVNHVNIQPDLPPQVVKLLDQIHHWKLRALEAEARKETT